MTTFNITYSVCYWIDADNLDEAIAMARDDSGLEDYEIQAITWEDDNGYHIEQF